jgi:hypothetical protein
MVAVTAVKAAGSDVIAVEAASAVEGVAAGKATGRTVDIKRAAEMWSAHRAS